MAELENILSGQNESAPEKVETERAETQVQSEQTEATTQEQPQGQKMVPHEALHAEKQKVKRYTEQVASFEQTIKQRDEAMERRFTQMLERLTPQQQPEQQIDWYADPGAATRQELGRAISPLESKFSQLETSIMRLSAVQQHGAEKVTAFEKYVAEAMGRGDPEMAALSAQMRASPDPIGVGLDWFEKKTFDPEAERNRIREEVMKELQTQQTQTTTAQVMPSGLAAARNVGTRVGPAWSGPRPIADIFKT